MDLLAKARASVGIDPLLTGSCFETLLQKPGTGEMRSPLSQCFSMIAKSDLVERLNAEGAFLLSPGWVETWRQKLSAWGFDQATARIFFNEFARSLVLLDTGAYPECARHLAEFGEYLDLPVKSIPVGLKELEAFYSRAVATGSSLKLE
jgi:hypothetical protein